VLLHFFKVDSYDVSKNLQYDMYLSVFVLLIHMMCLMTLQYDMFAVFVLIR